MHKSFFAALCIFFVCSRLILSAQSKPIVSLQVQFIRTEQREAEAVSVAGSISYLQNPLAFVFETTSPVRQTTYLNADGAFLVDGAAVYDLSSSAPLLRQTCTDFLTWFKSDFALREGGYAPTACALQNGRVVSSWTYTKADTHPIAEIVVESNADGFFTCMQMFDAEHTLITKTSLSQYQKNGAYAYPTHIVSESFEQGKPVFTTTLTFTRVAFNQLTESPFTGKQYTALQLAARKQAAFSYRQAQKPDEQAYRVSIPAVSVGAGFALYKKYITKQDMSQCPYEPSCSQYMLQAVSQNGIFGIIQGLERKRRCTADEHKRGLYPDTQDGKHYDPLPPKATP